MVVIRFLGPMLLVALAYATLAGASPDSEETDESKKGGDAAPGQAKKAASALEELPSIDGATDRSGESSSHKRVPGQLEVTDEGVQGRYVEFVGVPETCDLRDHEAGGARFFQSVRLTGACRDTEIHRSEFRLKGDDAYLAAHDAPTGLLHFRADPAATIQFDLAPDVAVEPTAFGFSLTQGDVRARFIVDPTAAERTPTGFAVRGAGGNFLADAPASNLLARPELRAAVEAGALGANVDLIMEDGRPVVDAMALDDLEVRATTTGQGALRVWVESDLPSGRALALHLPAHAYAADRLRVDYFDLDETGQATPVPITVAQDLDDAWDVASGEGAEFAAVSDGPWVHVVVSVPHFSAHVLEVSSLEALARPSIVGGLVLGVLASTEAAAFMLMGRRNKE